jgi:hypothetical protein
VDGEVVAAVEEERRAVRTIQLGYGLASFHMAGVVGDCDDVVEDDVFGQQVEEVPTIRNAVEALLDDPKERSSALKSSRSVIVVVVMIGLVVLRASELPGRKTIHRVGSGTQPGCPSCPAGRSSVRRSPPISRSCS